MLKIKVFYVRRRPYYTPLSYYQGLATKKSISAAFEKTINIAAGFFGMQSSKLPLVNYTKILLRLIAKLSPLGTCAKVLWEWKLFAWQTRRWPRRFSYRSRYSGNREYRTEMHYSGRESIISTIFGRVGSRSNNGDVNFTFPADAVANWLQNSTSENNRHLEIKLTGTLEIAAGFLKEIDHLLNELTEASILLKSSSKIV